MNRKWLIWSCDKNQWWKPDACGYTSFPHEAGRYTFEEALGFVREGNSRLESDDHPIEMMVPEW